MLTPNTHVSRTVRLRVSAKSLANQLRRVCLDTPPQPVRVLFTDAGMSVWTHDLAKTMHVFLSDAPLVDYKVKEPCVLLVNPKEFSDTLALKFKDSQVQIRTEANQEITINDKVGNSSVIYPADEDDCAIVPDHWQIPDSDTKEGWKHIPQKGEDCTTRVEMSRSELVKAMVDMQVASAPYCEFAFADKHRTVATSGHWTSKTNRSMSKLDCTTLGSSVSVGLTDDSLTRLLSITTSDDFVFHKHIETPFVVAECGDMVVTLAETQKGA